MRTPFTRLVPAAILMTSIPWTTVAAQQHPPLPAFTAVAASGVAVTSDRLNAADRWVLVYVVPGTVVCDRLLRAVDEWTVSDGSRVVVVAAGPAAVLTESIRPLLTGSSSIALYADPDGSAAGALGVTTGAALVGVADGALHWMVQGVLNDPRMVESVVRSWLRVP
jgi:hypothetical protein